MKLRSHKLLLDQMAAFDVRNAKCTLPADRGPIEQQVRELFKDGDVLEDQEAKATGDVDAGEAGSFLGKPTKHNYVGEAWTRRV